jgi:sulfur-oxidizing protein SoxY
MKRRGFLGAIWLAAFSAAFSTRSRAQVAALDPAIQSITKGARLVTGRVHLEMPVIADNGNSVPIRVTVDSAMTEQDHVRAIHLVAEKNPVRHMAAFHLGPDAGRAQLDTRVRLAGSQTLTVLAAFSDGTFGVDRSRIQVTVSACADESDWNK